MFKGVLKQDCPGLCGDKNKREMAITVAMDCARPKSEELTTTFMDVDWNSDVNRRIPKLGGRGIVVIEGIQHVAATNYCMAVCCIDLALYLMNGRWGARDRMTVIMVSTIWPEGKRSARKFDSPFRRHKDEAEVAMA